MISKTTCDNCGSPLIPGARFCRQCGKLLADSFEPSSVTEATTRVFDASADAAAPPFTQHVNARPTGPAYVAPGEAQFIQTPPAAGPPKKSRVGKILLISFGVIALFIAVVSLAVVAALWNRRPGPGPAVAVPGRPPMPPPPNAGPPPDAGPPPPGAPVAPSAGEFIYPGAATVMNFGQGDGGAVIQLRTEDSFDKVFNWYAERLKPAQIVRPPGDSTGVIRSEKAAAIITAVDGQTNIMLKRDAP